MNNQQVLLMDNFRNVFDCSVNMKFAEYIETNQIKRADLAKAVDVHKCSISQIMNNRMQISPALRIKLNEYLGTNF